MVDETTTDTVEEPADADVDEGMNDDETPADWPEEDDPNEQEVL